MLVQETGHRFGAASPSADGSGGEAVLLADMDGDGLVDLVSAIGPAVRIGRGNGDGTFQPPVLVPATDISGFGRYFAVGDLDGDGLPDLVYAGTYPYVRRNLGGLTFGPEVQLAGGYVPYPDLIDVDGDGDLDVVLGYDPSSSWGSAQLLVFLNDGHGNLGSATALDLPFAPESIAAGDVTGDGIPDLVVTNHLSDEVVVLRGLGGGAFDPAFTRTAVSHPSRPLIVDVTGDGKPDLVIGSWYPRWELRIYPGGQPGFATPIVIPVPVAPREILAVDVDSDGWKDLVVSGTGVAVLRAIPGGGLAAPVVYEGGSRSGLAAADLDGDLRPDVVLGTDGTFTGYVVLRNRCLP